MITIYNNRITRTTTKKGKRIDEDQLYLYLNNVVVLDDKVTFERLMHLVSVNKTLTNIIFHGSLGGFDVEDFFNDMNQPIPDDVKNDHKSEYLEIYNFTDIWKYNKEDKRFEFGYYNGFHIMKTEKKNVIPTSMAFVKLNTLKKHRVIINNDIDIIVNDTTKPVKKRNFKPILKVKNTTFRVYDLFDAILHEISWHGSPKHRDRTGDELIKTVNQVYDIK